jgi:hypothetical protein
MKKSLLALACALATLTPLAVANAQNVYTLDTTGSGTSLDVGDIGAASSAGEFQLSTLGLSGVNNYFFQVQSDVTGASSFLSDFNPNGSVSSSILGVSGSGLTSNAASPISTSFNLTPGTVYDLQVSGAAGTSFIANVQAVSAAPEPATWALMVLGIGAIGVAMRRSRQAARGALAAA